MSTLKVDAIIDRSDGNTTTINGQTPTSSNMQGRNLIINGAMEVSQRATSFSSAANGSYTLDRFLWYDTGAGVVDISQATDTPNGNFKNSLKVDVTTADASLAAGDLYTVLQHIEGTVSSQLGWGTSAAKNATVSFWIKSPKSGTHSVAVQNNAQNRSRSEEFTVSAANTWEHKSVTFVGDTSGTWLTTTGLGIRISFPLAAGSTFTQAAGSWGTGNIYASPNQVNCMDDAANNFYITGIQMEVGDVATDFEHMSFADELLRCQRYYQINYATWYGVAAASGYFVSTTISYRPDVRANPTVAQASFSSGSAGRFTSTAATSSSINGTTVYSSPGSAGGNSGWSATWSADAEI